MEEILALALLALTGGAVCVFTSLTPARVRHDLWWTLWWVVLMGGAAGVLFDCWVSGGLPISG